MLKKVSLITLASLLVLSLSAMPASANKRNHKINHSRTVRVVKHNRNFYINRVRLISLQLGSTTRSMYNLNHGFHKMSTKKIKNLYSYLLRAYKQINHHTYLAD